MVKKKTFDVEAARAKIALIKEERKYRDIHEPVEIKKVRRVWGKEARQKISEESKIRGLERGIEKRSVLGRVGEKFAKGFEKTLKSKVISRRILKKEPQATYTVESAPRSSSFQKAWSKESMLKWS